MQGTKVSWNSFYDGSKIQQQFAELVWILIFSGDTHYRELH